MEDQREPTAQPPKVIPLKAKLSPEAAREWNETMEAGVKAQQLIKEAVVVGGTASALYAGHRISFDTDHLLTSLPENFDEVLETLSQSSEWKTARTKRPVLILGSINGVEVGFRQMRRSEPLETVTLETPYGKLVAPTLGELIGMKAYLAYSRNATRDYLDFAALSECATEDLVLSSLLKLERQYGELQTASICLEVAKALAQPEPYDLSATDLSRYKALAPEWQDWKKTEEICRRYGLLLGEKIVEG